MKHIIKVLVIAIGFNFFNISYGIEYDLERVTSDDDFNIKYESALSADGRYLAYVNSSFAYDDIYIRDNETSTVTYLHINALEGISGISISADARYVVFSSSGPYILDHEDTNEVSDIFIHDRETGVTERVSNGINKTEANGASYNPVISADGHYMVFVSEATNLITTDTNNEADFFLYNTETAATRRITEADSHSYYDTAISADGRYIAFSSCADNLPNGTNKGCDLFLYDQTGNAIERISVDLDEEEIRYYYAYNPAISADGRYVTYELLAVFEDGVEDEFGDGFPFQTVDIFVYDHDTNTTTQITNADKTSYESSSNPTISADGRYISFVSDMTSLVDNDNNDVDDIFVYDQETKNIERVNISSLGEEADDDSFSSIISADGKQVVFYSYATNLQEDSLEYKGLYLVELGDDLLKNGDAQNEFANWNVDAAKAGICKVKKSDRCFKLLKGSMYQQIDLTAYADRISGGLDVKITALMRANKKSANKSQYPNIYVSFENTQGDILEAMDLGEVSTNKWTEESLETEIPATATQMTVTLFLENEGKKPKSYGLFDQISVVIPSE